MGIISLTIIIMFFGWIKVSEPIPQSDVTQKSKEIQKPPTKPPLVIPELVKKINARNAEITSFSCNDASVKVWQSGSRYRVSGELYYEKEQRFRLRIESILGDEFDMGSNDELFWYWSRRDKDPGLHWATHEDYNKTRLKAAFNPHFMMRSFGLSEIKIKEDTKIVETETDLIIVYPQTSATGKPILVSIFIDKAHERVSGYVVTDMNGKPRASADIQEYRNGLPYKILYVWHAEDKALLIEFDKSKLNQSISARNWEMPDKKPKLNMAED
jgi:hypothetical protein